MKYDYSVHATCTSTLQTATARSCSSHGEIAALARNIGEILLRGCLEEPRENLLLKAFLLVSSYVDRRVKERKDNMYSFCK